MPDATAEGVEEAVIFLYEPMIRSLMAKKNDNSFQSSAGLMRYFDTENEKGIRVSPRTVIGIAIGVVIVVLLLNTLVPL